MVKRLRLRPFKAATRVRVPLALPDTAGVPDSLGRLFWWHSRRIFRGLMIGFLVGSRVYAP